MIFPKKFKLILSECNALITYKPLYNEVDFTTIPFLKKKSINEFSLPNDKDSDCFLYTDICKKKYEKKFVCILIPGRKFDIYGTRHGRGGGWYDRFLEKIPKDWIRIGIAHRTQLSFSKIHKETWDEAVDWIVIDNDGIYEIYETNARKYCLPVLN